MRIRDCAGCKHVDELRRRFARDQSPDRHHDEGIVRQSESRA
jgi:hypothetical protein